jgi:hypothetical protein
MKRLAALAALVGALICVEGAAAQPEPVLAGDAYEVEPSPGDAYFAWAQASPSRPNQYNVWFAPVVGGAPDVSARIRVNPAGAVAFAGDVDGTTLVYAQRPRQAAPGSVRFYDVATQAPLDTPPGINTRRGREAGPKLSGNWLLFARYGRSGQTIFLYDLTRERKTRVDRLPYPGHLQTGAVAGNWAAWTRCRRWAHCHTFRYDIAADRTLRVPNPRDRSQYAASVTEDGAVYYAESRSILCGDDLAIWRDANPRAAGRARLLDFRSGRDVAVTSPVVNGDGSVTVYYDRYVCRTGAADIYRYIFAPGP